MARIACGLLSLLILIGASGCTWTETYNEFPPSASDDHQHNHQHDHAQSDH